MKTIVKSVYIIFSAILLLYLALPTPDFPLPPPGALQSREPADTETILRRSYFTNFTRGEVLKHYQKQFEKISILGIPLPTFRLNYPPEEAQTIIRDQTRSTFLEEIVHPMRESFFVNGFEPKLEKDTIIIEGRVWLQKITVRYVPSNRFVRLTLGVATIIIMAMVNKLYRSAVPNFLSEVKRKWTFR